MTSQEGPPDFPHSFASPGAKSSALAHFSSYYSEGYDGSDHPQPPFSTDNPLGSSTATPSHPKATTASITSAFQTSASTTSAKPVSHTHTTSSTTPSFAANGISEKLHKMTTGQMAATVSASVIFAALLGLLIFLLLKRRRRHSQDGATAAFFPAMREKMGSIGTRRRQPPPGSTSLPAPTAVAPILTSHQNNAYFTGLDTSSHASHSRPPSGEYYAPARRSEGGTTFAEPPPPYRAKTSSQRSRQSRQEQPSHTSEDNASGNPRALSPFDDPDNEISISQTIAHNLRQAAVGVGMARPGTALSRTNRHGDGGGGDSINTSEYSDSASIHSARAARMSVGSAYIIETMSVTSSGGGDGRESYQKSERTASDPFVSPIGSPVGSLAGSGTARDGRRDSDVSELEHETSGEQLR